MSFTMPVYMVDFTPKTIAALISQQAVTCEVVELDVYERSNVSIKQVATGQRSTADRDIFKVTTVSENGVNEHDWNYTILRESADRSRVKK
jgi:hypothetical protein